MKKVLEFFRSFFGHNIIKNSIIVLAGSMLANIFAYLYHLIIGRILGPDRYGELAALLSLFYILNVPAQSLQTVMTKYFSEFKVRQQSGQAKSLLYLITRWALLFEIVGFIILFPLAGYLANFLHVQTKVNFIWLYLIFSMYLVTVIQLSVYQGYQLFFMSNIIVNIGSLLRLLLGALGAVFGVGMTLLSNVLSNLLIYGVGFIPLKFLLGVKAESVNINKRGIIGYSIPTLITTFGIVALYSQDVVLVKHFFQSYDAGIYSSLSVLGKVIFYASSALGYVLFPVVAERNELKVGHRKIVLTGLAVIAVISLILTGFYFTYPKLVVDLLFGKAFYGAIGYLGYFGMFITFFSLSSLLSSVCLASGKTKVWILAGMAATAQTVLIWRYHATIFSVIWVNLVISGILFFTLLLYYGYAKE